MRIHPINNTDRTEMTTSLPPSINLKTIMADQKKVILKHGDKPYLLSITRRGKLILTAAAEANNVECSEQTPRVDPL